MRLLLFGKIKAHINSKLANEYETSRRKLTEEHAENLLRTESVSAKCDDEVASAILETILKEELETGRQLSDPKIQEKGYAMIRA